MTPADFVGFFRLLFNSLIKLGDIDSLKAASVYLSAASKVARAKYQAALKLRPPQAGAGGGFQAPSAGGAGGSIIPPRPAGTVPTGGTPPPRPYDDGIDFRVKSSWIAAFAFRPLHAGRGGVVQQYQGSPFPSKTPANTGDLTLTTIRASYVNPTGRYVYPNVPRAIMDAAVKAPSPGRFYWRVLRYYSNRSLIGRRMRRTSRRLLS